MKKKILIPLCIIIALGIAMCKKKADDTSRPVATCTSCNGALLTHKLDSNGLYYYLPTAFTPNGDGVNDVFRMVYGNLVVDSSTISIWDLSGNGVFIGTINESWDGTDLHGNKLPVGKYPLYMKLRTNTGSIITSCGCVSILGYKGSCIYTGGYPYYLADQVDTANGFTYPTNENLCP